MAARPASCSRLRRAFTLTELLVVIGLIAVLATFVGVSLGGNEGQSLAGGQRIASGIFSSARNIALARQAPARVIIYADDADPNKRLRFMGIVYNGDANLDGTIGPNEWLPANSGTYLPRGVYYTPPSGQDPSYLQLESSVGGSFERSRWPSGAPTTENIAFPSEDNNPEEYFYYEFNPNGTSEDSGAVFIITAGELRGATGGTDIVLTNPFQISGFVIRKLGNVTLFTDYDDIAEVPIN